MIIENTTDLGNQAIEFPMKYNGFLGVSILHKYFSKNNMRCYFQWGSKIFNKFVILLMDDPDQYNFNIFKKMNKKQALIHARKISNELKQGYEKELLKLGIENVKVVQYKDFINNKKYKLILKEISKFFTLNSDFKNDLLKLMEVSIGRKIDKLDLNGEKLQNAKNNLSKYLLEELASVIFFSENGYPIEVDPTIEFVSKTRLYRGDFQMLSNKLKLTRRGHIFAHPRDIEKSSY